MRSNGTTEGNHVVLLTYMDESYTSDHYYIAALCCPDDQVTSRLNARYEMPAKPHTIVLQHLMERVNGFALRCDPAQRALLIADEVDGQDGHRQSLWRYRREGTPGYRSSRLEQIIDTIHFAPSRSSRLLQAADLVAYMHRRRQTVVEADVRAKAANDRIWSRVADRVVHEWEWVP